MSIEVLSLAIRATLPSPTQKLVLVILADRAASDGWQTIEGRLDAERLGADVCASPSALEAALQALCRDGVLSIRGETYWIDAARLEELAGAEVTA